MMKSINRLVFVRRWQGVNLPVLPTQRTICSIWITRKWAGQKWLNRQQLIQPHTGFI
jgi:hypothetical protein